MGIGWLSGYPVMHCSPSHLTHIVTKETHQHCPSHHRLANTSINGNRSMKIKKGISTQLLNWQQTNKSLQKKELMVR